VAFLPGIALLPPCKEQHQPQDSSVALTINWTQMCCCDSASNRGTMKISESLAMENSKNPLAFIAI